MKNLSSLFLLAITGGAAYYFLRGKKEAIENLDIKPIDIAIDTQKSRKLFFAKLFYNIKFKIKNPSGFAVKILEIDLEFLVNNKFIANIEKKSPIVIKPGEEKIITIESSLSTTNIIQQVLDMLTGDKTIDLAIQGFVKTDLGVVNVSYNKPL